MSFFPKALSRGLAALLALTVPTATVDTRAQTPVALSSPVAAACGSTPTAPPEPHKGQPHFSYYLEDTYPQLKAAVPVLKGLKFEAHPAIEGQLDESVEILNQTSAVINTMLPRVPNLLAKEELSQSAIALPYTLTNTTQSGVGIGGGGRRSPPPTYTDSSRNLEGDDLYKIVRASLDDPKNRVAFTFRIQSTHDDTYGNVLSESRINSKNESIEMSATGAGHPHSVGFSNSWLMFLPESLKESRFHYLGRQKLDKRDTVVVAFAQIPDQVPNPPRIAFGQDFCPYYMQGLLWIDASIFQIVRMQTDLIAPLPYNETSRLRSLIRFTEIHIPERNLALWMPSDVEISWQTKGQFGAELHKYSNYRLFGATSRLIIPDPE